ncbi:MAG: ABC transporter ATP-binding protein [Desulfobacteraceae bacterium]|nr:ABC transporter ATP-binding protein [Desulfobacteraceae bacterium]
MARIDLKQIAHSYHDGAQKPEDFALRRVHESWDDGGAYALLGPSGCGKTTLLNIISGLLTPSRGSVFFDGQDVTALPPENRNIAQVFQFPVLYDTMTVFGNLAFPLRNRGVDTEQIRQRVNEVADILDLTTHLKKKASGLSADVKQKISLGRGLVRSDVAAILFDEPLTVIDPQLKWHLRCKLKQIHERLKLTLIYVTHDQVEALTFADRVMVMHGGKMLQAGAPEDLFEKPEHKFVGYFIGSPGMNFLSCILDGNIARVNGAAIELADATAALAKKAGQKLEIGIRPTYLKVHSNKQPGSIAATIKNVEDQGSFKIVTLILNQQTLRARIPEDQPIPDKKAWLSFPTQKIRLYADGQLLRAQGAS